MEFACKNFNLEEVIRCGFNLTKADFLVFEFLMKNHTKKIKHKSAFKRIKFRVINCPKDL